PSNNERLRKGNTGVDASDRLDPTRTYETRSTLHAAWNFPERAIVVGFVGRLVKHKAIGELAESWQHVKAACPDARLLLVGPFEDTDPVPLATRQALENDPTVRLVGFRSDIERCYAAMDLLVLPSHREGFPTSPLEAAAMKLPVVASRAT